LSLYDDWQMDDYADYEAQFDPMTFDRQARRKRKPKVKHTPKKDARMVLDEIADTVGLESGFETTYRPGLFEEGWLLDSLRAFYDQQYITDVLARVRGGKEANVYRCAGHPNTGQTLLAAKVYRPRMFRELSNDKLYREGRGILTAEGQDANQSIHADRVRRAVGKKTAFGRQVAHTSWLMHEFTSLQRLYDAGAAVPRPIAAADNAILMGYCGDENLAAPTLNTVTLADDEAAPLFDEIMRHVELMLQHGLIHGDLSAYNILYWQGQITLIDFPQVVNSQTNSSAADILRRDVLRVCEYFARQGLERDGEAISCRLWRRYLAQAQEIRAMDALARAEAEDEA
jgi:RIO kinase 1